MRVVRLSAINQCELIPTLQTKKNQRDHVLANLIPRMRNPAFTSTYRNTHTHTHAHTRTYMHIHASRYTHARGNACKESASKNKHKKQDRKAWPTISKAFSGY